MADVQSLILDARKGSVAAYEALVNHYQALAAKRSANVARRNPSVDATVLESDLVWTFQRCFEAYDESIGPFEHLVNRSWLTAVTNVIRDAAISKHTRLSTMSLDADGEICERVAAPVNVEAELLADLAIDEYRRRVRREDENLEKVVVLIAQGGYSHVEIARECGYVGTDAGAKMWTRRAIERIRAIFTEEAS